MNERTEALAKQAAEYAIEFAVKNQAQYIPKLMEKFAELIVQECIDKITSYDLTPGHSAKWEDIYEIHARLLQDLGEELKEHFGVEE